LITINDIEPMASAFNCMYPKGTSRQKTAVVVDQGLTEAIVLLWIRTLRKKVPFDLEVFHTIEKAKHWLGISEVAA